MASQQTINEYAKATANAESYLKLSANNAQQDNICAPPSPHQEEDHNELALFSAGEFLIKSQHRPCQTLKEVTTKLTKQKQHGKLEKLTKAISHYSRAGYRELVPRLLVLPREIRDMIYDELWSLGSSKEYLMNQLVCEDSTFGRYRRRSAKHGHRPSNGRTVCHLPSFSKRAFVGAEVAREVLDAFRRRDSTSEGDGSRAHYVSWENLHDFTTAKVFQSGFTLYELLENLDLFIVFDCVDQIDGNEGLERIGIPGCFNAKLRRCIDTLSSLRHRKPRSITFQFIDLTDGVPSSITYLFRSLSVPFHELRHLGFDVRVIYGAFGVFNWDMSGEHNHHGSHTEDVWNWTLRDWSLNFTRTNGHFKEASFMDRTFVFNPNGPLSGRYRVKKPIWEALRKELYRAYPDVDTAVKWTKNTKGEIWIDCGCVDEEHTCCTFYLCGEHGGWDWRSGRLDDDLNTYCYICKGLVAPAL
jgi:hypothetical protein